MIMFWFQLNCFSKVLVDMPMAAANTGLVNLTKWSYEGGVLYLWLPNDQVEQLYDLQASTKTLKNSAITVQALANCLPKRPIGLKQQEEGYQPLPFSWIMVKNIFNLLQFLDADWCSVLQELNELRYAFVYTYLAKLTAEMSGSTNIDSDIDITVPALYPETPEKPCLPNTNAITQMKDSIEKFTNNTILKSTNYTYVDGDETWLFDVNIYVVNFITYIRNDLIRNLSEYFDAKNDLVHSSDELKRFESALSATKQQRRSVLLAAQGFNRRNASTIPRIPSSSSDNASLNSQISSPMLSPSSRSSSQTSPREPSSIENLSARNLTITDGNNSSQYSSCPGHTTKRKTTFCENYHPYLLKADNICELIEEIGNIFQVSPCALYNMKSMFKNGKDYDPEWTTAMMHLEDPQITNYDQATKNFDEILGLIATNKYRPTKYKPNNKLLALHKAVFNATIAARDQYFTRSAFASVVWGIKYNTITDNWQNYEAMWDNLGMMFHVLTQTSCEEPKWESKAAKYLIRIGNVGVNAFATTNKELLAIRNSRPINSFTSLVQTLKEAIKNWQAHYFTSYNTTRIVRHVIKDLNRSEGVPENVFQMKDEHKLYQIHLDRLLRELDNDLKKTVFAVAFQLCVDKCGFLQSIPTSPAVFGQRVDLNNLEDIGNGGSTKKRPRRLEDLTIKDLKTRCKERGVRGVSKMNKGDLIAALRRRARSS